MGAAIDPQPDLRRSGPTVSVYGATLLIIAQSLCIRAPVTKGE
jgi:hypothetical protein